MWLTAPTVEILLPGDERAPGPGTWAVLQDHLGWRDSDGTEHWLPKGFAWNGSSIPRSLWWLMGHPLRSRYLRSSALHDEGCASQKEPASVVHKRFYHGLRADGESWLKANLKWRAVDVAGPQW